MLRGKAHADDRNLALDALHDEQVVNIRSSEDACGLEAVHSQEDWVAEVPGGRFKPLRKCGLWLVDRA